MFEQTAERVAAQVTNELAPSFRVPLRLVCPSREAEQAVLGAVTRAAQTRQIPVEVIDLEPDPAGRLNSLTSQLDDWDAIKSGSPHPTMPTLLILRGFDAFGDDRHEDPTYPFRSKFQFDEKFLWLFMGHDESRMRFLFESYRRPLYQAAVDITPAIWRSSIDVAEM